VVALRKSQAVVISLACGLLLARPPAEMPARVRQEARRLTPAAVFRDSCARGNGILEQHDECRHRT
jgi:hypothetical protein